MHEQYGFTYTLHKYDIKSMLKSTHIEIGSVRFQVEWRFALLHMSAGMKTEEMIEASFLHIYYIVIYAHIQCYDIF